jgi:hypothetical protein
VTVGSNARILRVEPGAKDLKSAQPFELSGLKVGDHILVYGRDIAPDAKIFPDGHRHEAGDHHDQENDGVAAVRAGLYEI